ncbi:uncharacterized protein B0T23DRAFT_199119 [Neurospora hispaniola]|uniref:Nudix hydrolase domain-containing protein n=1 Tax=Neurospora hispaniola TaxID=588809 RepID=A0AAJ0MPJ8_9PEZI|nr:hypothetical protein B0T23DRAFT_199119 [Neurospora hispaniola]
MAIDLQPWLDGIDASMVFHPANAFVISCGTVTLDLGRGKVLLIWNRNLSIFQLPKGRRNIDEPMLNAALRETYEETGVRATPLELNIATRATPPTVDEGADGPPQKSPQITEGHLSTEFVGTCLYPDPQSDTKALKAVFFFVATADSTATRDNGTQETYEKLEASWVLISEVDQKLRFASEVAVVKKAVADVRKSGYTINNA